MRGRSSCRVQFLSSRWCILLWCHGGEGVPAERVMLTYNTVTNDHHEFYLISYLCNSVERLTSSSLSCAVIFGQLQVGESRRRVVASWEAFNSTMRWRKIYIISIWGFPIPFGIIDYQSWPRICNGSEKTTWKFNLHAAFVRVPASAVNKSIYIMLN